MVVKESYALIINMEDRRLLFKMTSEYSRHENKEYTPILDITEEWILSFRETLSLYNNYLLFNN